MSNNEIPEALKKRYKNISTINYGSLKIASLEKLNVQCIAINQERNTMSYKIFAREFNSIMLTAHMFENLIIFEDRRHEQLGNFEFQIKIPEIYFQHPSLNDDIEIKEESKENISSFVESTKQMLNFSKDQSFVVNNLYKLEFISVFSHLEAYIENLLVEFLELSKEQAAAKVRRENLPKLMTEPFEKINPKINTAISLLDKDAMKFISFCHKLRNLHTHNLGIVTNYFYDKCLEENMLCHDKYVDSGESVLEYARPNFNFCSYIFEVGRHVNLNAFSQPFRLFTREIVYISEFFCQEKI